nr:hypothetical protein CFP56_09156 [Quercus suber]
MRVPIPSTTSIFVFRLTFQFSLTCRQRKLKCDEQRPVCSQCIKAQRVCVPSSGITFRHQQNPSMNGAEDDPGNLKSFYGYKETFKKGTQWVKIPPQLTFVHTKNPYEDGDDGFEGGGQLGNAIVMNSGRTMTGPAYNTSLPLVDSSADMSSTSATYDNINERLMAGLASAAESAVVENASRFEGQSRMNKYDDFEPASTSYPTYATHGLEALSAVASQGQYNSFDISLPVPTSPAEALQSHPIPASCSPQQGNSEPSRQTPAHETNTSVDILPRTDSNIDPRLHSATPVASTYQTPPANSDEP